MFVTSHIPNRTYEYVAAGVSPFRLGGMYVFVDLDYRNVRVEFSNLPGLKFPVKTDAFIRSDLPMDVYIANQVTKAFWKIYVQPEDNIVLGSD